MIKIDRVLNDFVFVDDLLVVSKSWDSHLAHLHEVFSRLKAAQLKSKTKKCKLVIKEVAFLGHKLTQDGLDKDEAIVAAMKNFLTPKQRL